MARMAAQISVYPLRRTNIAAAVRAVLAAFAAHPVAVTPGAMSSIVAGDEEAVFAALADGYRTATQSGDAVMVLTLSNACPVPAPPGPADPAPP